MKRAYFGVRNVRVLYKQIGEDSRVLDWPYNVIRDRSHETRIPLEGTLEFIVFRVIAILFGQGSSDITKRVLATEDIVSLMNEGEKKLFSSVYHKDIGIIFVGTTKDAMVEIFKKATYSSERVMNLLGPIH